MSSTRAPAWALMAEAIDGIGDPHLPPGIHVRVLPTPRLGLPATPLFVHRSVVEPGMVKQLARINGIAWIDSAGESLSPPFDVTPGNPVTGYFPVRNVMFAELDATPSRARGPRLDLKIQKLEELLRGRRKLGRFARRSDLDDFIQRASKLLDSYVDRGGSLRFEALADTARGQGVFQSRDEARYVLAAGNIPAVRVVGSGRVDAIRWIEGARLLPELKEQLWAIWSLPVKRAPRYSPTSTALADAKARVERAGVVRQPMHVAYSASAPATAPAATPADALARVAQVRAELDRWLGELLHDLSAPPADLRDKQTFSSVDETGSVEVPMEAFLLAGSVDPDVGHHLGFGDVDQSSPPTAGSLVLYRIRGLWRWGRSRWSQAELGAFAAGMRLKKEDALREFSELEKHRVAPTERGPFVDLDAMAVAVAGIPPGIPPQVNFDGTSERGWLATPPPPDVRRALRLTATGFRPLALAAVAATDSNGDRTLHPFPGVGRIAAGAPVPPGTPLSLVVSRPAEAEVAGEARFEDRAAPEGPVLYRLAQADWYGRWSPWVTRTAPPKARTPPLRPTIELFAHPPTVATPVPDGPLSATLELRIPIPRTADLPAGGAALARLDLDESHAGSPTTTIPFTLGSLSGASIEPQTAPLPDILVIHRAGPPLERATTLRVSYTARWFDVLGLVSPDADPAARTIVDPRPPPPPVVETELRYTARPDAEGHARVDLDFATVVNTRYRIFASTETTLLAALDSSGQMSAAIDIRSAGPGAPRAMKFKQYKGLFSWDHFECLTKEPIVATSTTTRFVHRVSGSLEGMAVYRVVGEGPSGALSDLAEAELVPFAVPNLGGPARPSVSVVQEGTDPTIGGVRLEVYVPAGKATPKAWRIRRASVPIEDPLRMRIVATGVVGSAVVDARGTAFEIEATEPLKPWRQYRFAVEVQADDPPGAPSVGVLLPGEWSEASSIATVAAIPPSAPMPPSGVQLQAVGAELSVSVQHPTADSLVGTALGPHRFEVWRVEPGARPALRELAFSRGPGDTWVATDPSPAPTMTYVTVRIVDPIGRRSDATISPPL